MRTAVSTFLFLLTTFGLAMLTHGQANNGGSSQNASETNPRSVSKADIALAKRIHKEGVRYGRAKLSSQAIASFQQAIRLDPYFADAYYGLGLAYLDLGQWQEAIVAFEHAIRLEPKEKAYRKLAEANAMLRFDNRSRLDQERTLNSQAETQGEIRPGSSNSNKTPGGDSPATAVRNASKALFLPSVKSRPVKMALHLKPQSPAATTVDQSLQWVANEIRLPPPPHRAKKALTIPGASIIEPELQHLAFSAEVNVTPDGKGSGLTMLRLLEATEDLNTTSVPVWNKEAQLRATSDIALEQTGVSTASAGLSTTAPKKDQDDLSRIYRVGVGDVLDVRLREDPGAQSTLFTVTASGLLEHPILSYPMKVEGLTTDEISERFATDLKNRAANETPEILVGVREYVSHTILVSGTVKEPGTKILRREAIPLYVVLADAQPLQEAGRVTIISHETQQTRVLDLSDTNAMGHLVRPGDVVMVQPNIREYFYIGGSVKSPGEKLHRTGLTLTQAILMAGGLSGKVKEVQIARENQNGLLSVTRLKLKEINEGKRPDEQIRPGDRITVAN